jgi:beta-glucosidase
MKCLKSYLILLIISTNIYSTVAQDKYPFLDPKLSLDKRVDNIISLLTLEEKIDLLTGFQVSRLGITNPGNAEGIHQAVIRNFRPDAPPIKTTSFAQVYGMGETWNPELIKKAGTVEAYEARYATQNERYKRPTLILFGPTADLARDPRWGRTDESYSEDAYLTGTMSAAFSKGIQGDNPDYWMAASLLKHVFANSNETTRGRSSSNFDNRLMREYYSVPFRITFMEGGAKSYMAAYNAWNGVPMTVNPVLKDVIGKEWGADWIVSSDLGAIGLAVTGHKYMKSREEVVAAAIKIGMNQFLEMGPGIKEAINKSLADNLLTEEDINIAIRGKLNTIIKLGLLDPADKNPYSIIGKNSEKEPWNSEKHKAVALQVALESVVLLKDNNNLLPLDKSTVKSIAVIGPYADSVLYDFYSGTSPYSVSILQGLKNKLGVNVNIRYVKNNEYNAAVEAAKSSDFAIVVVGNDPMCGVKNPGQAFNQDGSTKECPECGDGREGRDRLSLDLPLEDLVKEVYNVNQNTIVVLVSSFPYAINWSQNNVPAILHITHAAQEQGTAIADVLFGDYNPAGRLVQTWPKSPDQLPRMLDYDIRNGRTYMYFKEEPLYPFGFGLSYTKFDYSNIKLSSDLMLKNGNLSVTADIKNTGNKDGDEVVQLYVQFPQSKVVRPIKELKGFHRIGLNAGETKSVTFTLKAESLAWWNEESNRWELESGPVNILIGGSSHDIKLTKTILVK